jgi:hypothetical protein
MGITWRTELHLTCDVYDLDPVMYHKDCEQELLMDQMDAKTKKVMFRVAKKAGWTWDDECCLCPSCSKKYSYLLKKPLNGALP